MFPDLPIILDLALVLDLADELKAERAHRQELRVLPGRTIGLIFHKPSTRTRVSFEAAAWRLIEEIDERGGAVHAIVGHPARRHTRQGFDDARPQAIPRTLLPDPGLNLGAGADSGRERSGNADEAGAIGHQVLPWVGWGQSN